MKRTRTTLGAVAALALLAMGGTAEASKASADTLCFVFDQSGGLASKCRVSTSQKSVDIRMKATPESAAEACPKMVGVTRQFKIVFDSGWSLRIFPPGNSNQPLAQCGF